MSWLPLLAPPAAGWLPTNKTIYLSMAKAAEIAGVSWAQMRDILLEKGVDPALGPVTLEEAQAEVNQLRDYLAGQA